MDNPSNGAIEDVGFYPKKPSAHLPFFLVIILEIGFILALILAILGILYFFHIIKLPDLSSSFPPQSSMTPTIAVTPFNTSQVDKTMTEYIINTFQPEFIPEEGLTSLKSRETPGGLRMTWYTKPGMQQVQIVARYDTQQTRLQEMKGYVYIHNPINNISIGTATNTINTYFKNTPSGLSWSCTLSGGKLGTATCSTFTTKNNQRVGYTIINMEKNPTVILNCLIPEESQDFYKQTSCISNGI